MDTEKKPKLGVQAPLIVVMPDDNGHATLFSIKVDHDPGGTLWYRATHAGSKITVNGDETSPGVMSHELCRGEPGKSRLLRRLVEAVDEFETRPRSIR